MVSDDVVGKEGLKREKKDKYRILAASELNIPHSHVPQDMACPLRQLYFLHPRLDVYLYPSRSTCNLLFFCPKSFCASGGVNAKRRKEAP